MVCPLFKRMLLVGFVGMVLQASSVQARDVKLSGMGIRKCSEWQQWKETGKGEARAMGLEWAQGFIAGHNVFARSGSEGASSVVADIKVLVPLLDTYCQKNPEDRLFLGVVSIIQSLGGANVNMAPKSPNAPSAPMPMTPRPNRKGEQES